MGAPNMKARLLILLVAAGGLAVYLGTRASAPPVDETSRNSDIDAEELRRIRAEQKRLDEHPLPGQEPPEPPELDIRVEVDPTGEKNRLYLYITEAHGYYVETFEIDFYYKPTPDAKIGDRPVFSVYLNDYLKAAETYKGCVEVVPAELRETGGTIGTSENWEARIFRYGRARMQNPKEFRPVSETGKCR